MKAEVKPYYDANRKKLADIIPIDHPFTVYIEQTKYCNFKCFYCIHSTRDSANGAFQKLGHVMKHMDFNMYKKIIKQLSEFPAGGIKRIVFSGLGEPLMNPRLPEMVKIAVDSKIANRVEVITNALLLTPDLSDRLIDAGITNINISIQGIDAEGYEKTCGVKIDFDRFVENLDYLYNHKKNTQIYIKAIDATFDSEEDKNNFFDIFGKIADRIYIEHLVVMQQKMDQLEEVVDRTKNFYGEEFDNTRKVCAQAFYFLQIGCEYDTFPCPNPGLSKEISMGNIKENSLMEIWNGEKRKKLLRTMLEFKKDSISDCNHCDTFNCINNPMENLDGDADKLIHYFK